MPGCAALNCSNSAKKGFLMKHFPRDPSRRKEWTRNMRRANWVATEYSCLCEVHFAPEMWEKTRVDGSRKLKCNAVPTVFPFTNPKGIRKAMIQSKPPQKSKSKFSPLSKILSQVHFAPEMWEKTRVDGSRKLKCNAVPTVFPFTNPKGIRKAMIQSKPPPLRKLKVLSGEALQDENFRSPSRPCSKKKTAAVPNILRKNKFVKASTLQEGSPDTQVRRKQLKADKNNEENQNGIKEQVLDHDYCQVEHGTSSPKSVNRRNSSPKSCSLVKSIKVRVIKSVDDEYTSSSETTISESVPLKRKTPTENPVEESPAPKRRCVGHRDNLFVNPEKISTPTKKAKCFPVDHERENQEKPFRISREDSTQSPLKRFHKCDTASVKPKVKFIPPNVPTCNPSDKRITPTFNPDTKTATKELHSSSVSQRILLPKGNESNLQANTEDLTTEPKILKVVSDGPKTNVVFNANQLKIPQDVPYLLKVIQGGKTYLLVPEMKTVSPEMKNSLHVCDDNHSVLNQQVDASLQKIQKEPAVVTGILIPINSGVNLSAPKVPNFNTLNRGVCSPVNSEVGEDVTSPLNSGVNLAAPEFRNSNRSNAGACPIIKSSLGEVATSSVNSGVNFPALEVPNCNLLNKGVWSPVKSVVGEDVTSPLNSGVNLSAPEFRNSNRINAGACSIIKSSLGEVATSSVNSGVNFPAPEVPDCNLLNKGVCSPVKSEVGKDVTSRLNSGVNLAASKFRNSNRINAGACSIIESRLGEVATSSVNSGVNFSAPEVPNCNQLNTGVCSPVNSEVGEDVTSRLNLGVNLAASEFRNSNRINAGACSIIKSSLGGVATSSVNSGVNFSAPEVPSCNPLNTGVCSPVKSEEGEDVTSPLNSGVNLAVPEFRNSNRINAGACSIIKSSSGEVATSYVTSGVNFRTLEVANCNLLNKGVCSPVKSEEGEDVTSRLNSGVNLAAPEFKNSYRINADAGSLTKSCVGEVATSSVNSGVNSASPEVPNCNLLNTGVCSPVKSEVGENVTSPINSRVYFASPEVRSCYPVIVGVHSSVNSEAGENAAAPINSRENFPSSEMHICNQVNAGVYASENSEEDEDVTSPMNSGVKSVTSKVHHCNPVDIGAASGVNVGVNSVNPDVHDGKMRFCESVEEVLDSRVNSVVKTAKCTCDEKTDTPVSPVVNAGASSERPKMIPKDSHISVPFTETTKRIFEELIEKLSRENTFLKERVKQLERQLANKC